MDDWINWLLFKKNADGDDSGVAFFCSNSVLVSSLYHFVEYTWVPVYHLHLSLWLIFFSIRLLRSCSLWNSPLQLMSVSCLFVPWFEVNYCGFSKEIIEIVVQNNQSSFFVSVTNCLLYFIGHSMRGMAMSLANRPFLTAESIYGDGCTTEGNRCDTQVVINKRVLWVRDRFLQLFFYSSDELRHLLFEVILIILRSGLMFVTCYAFYVVKLYNYFFRFWSLFYPFYRRVATVIS